MVAKFEKGELFQNKNEALRVLLDSVAFIVGNMRGLCIVPIGKHLDDEALHQAQLLFAPVGIKVCRESWPGLGLERDKRDVPALRFEPGPCAEDVWGGKL